MTKMTEQTMASLVVDWLEEQHWDVYQEVQFRTYSSVADIVAVRNNLLWIIECKKSLTFTVMDQARSWRAHLRSIAVPTVRNWRARKLPYEICSRYLKVGIITVSKYGTVDEHSWAPLMREFHRFSKEKMAQLSEGHKTHAKAGSANGGHFTPYRHTMDTVKRFIASNPGCTLKEIMEYLDDRHHYSSNKSAKQSIRKALESWEDWCRVDKSEREFKYFVKDTK